MELLRVSSIFSLVPSYNFLLFLYFSEISSIVTVAGRKRVCCSVRSCPFSSELYFSEIKRVEDCDKAGEQLGV